MSHYLPVCVVRTSDAAIKFFAAHEPIPARVGGPVTLNLNLEAQTVSLHLCKRCGVAYVDSETTKFAATDGVPIAPPPKEGQH